MKKENVVKKSVTDKDTLIKIFNKTRLLSKTLYDLDTKALKNKTKIYVDLESKPVANIPSTVTFMVGGTLEIGTKFVDKYHTALLNFADGVKPGGLPEYGVLTQEENLCRCTNMYEVLISDKCDAEYYSVNKEFDNFGLCTDRVMYLPDVAIFRDDITYDMVKTKYADIITCPAPSCGFKDDSFALSVYNKRIEQIILSAIDNNVECLVLGAWGCGAFAQDPHLIASAFVNNLNKYSGYFEKVIFAIKSTPGYGTSNSSYSIFLNSFKNEYNGLVIEGE